MAGIEVQSALKAAAQTCSQVAPGLAARILEQLFLTPTRHAPPAREELWLQGARSRRLGGIIPVHEWGEGPPVLLVHGWSGRGSQLGLFARTLASQGFRAVAFDAPAHGQAPGRLTGIPEFAATISRLAYELGPLHGVVAHSMGTAATTVAASRGVQLGRMVYVAPPADPLRYLQRAASAFGFSEPVVRRTKRRIEARFDFSLSEARVLDLAPRLEAPLLVVHDEGDRDVPFAEGEAIVARWQGAELLPTRDLGHRRILRDAEVAAAAVAFLAS